MFWADLCKPLMSKPAVSNSDIGLMCALLINSGAESIICKMPITRRNSAQIPVFEFMTMTRILSKPTQMKVHMLTSIKDFTNVFGMYSVSGLAKNTRNAGANMYCATRTAV